MKYGRRDSNSQGLFAGGQGHRPAAPKAAVFANFTTPAWCVAGGTRGQPLDGIVPEYLHLRRPARPECVTVKGRTARVHREPPGPERWKNRSRTYQGIADAMAAQWA